MSPPPGKRLQTATERDLAGIAARKDRDAAPVEVHAEISENYSGDQLEEMRETRKPIDRIRHLETKVDDWRLESTEQFGNMKAAIGELTGAVGGLTTVVENSLKQNHVTFTAQVDVNKADAIAKVNVGEAMQLDTVKAKAEKRALYAKLITAGVVGGGVLGKILHLIGVM